MSDGPTRGASEEQAWAARPGRAFAVRVFAVIFPIVASFVVARLASPGLWHPSGVSGAAVFVVQVAVVGSVAALLAERAVRRVLPLAVLLNMTLVFPDRAPSRFGLALRSGTVKQLQQSTSQGLSSNHQQAAEQLIAMVAALGRHDRLTRGHTERVRAYADLIGQEMDLPKSDREKLHWAAMVHDVGKLSVAPEILNSTGRPTDEQWSILRHHPTAGGELVEPLSAWLGQWRLAASQHHERWDGNGYPNGLAGTDISLAGRIVAVADAYDVITSKRSYKKAMSVVAARKEMVDCAGTQFDPDVVKALLSVSLERKKSRLGFLGWFTEVGGLAAAPRAVGQAIAATTTVVAATTAAVTATPLIATSEATNQAAQAVATATVTKPDTATGPDSATPTTAVAAESLPYAVDDSSESTTETSETTRALTNSVTEGPTTTAGQPSNTKVTTPAVANSPTTNTGQSTTVNPTTTISSTTTTTAASSTTNTTASGPVTTTTTVLSTTTTTAPPATTTTTTTAPPANVDWDLGGDGFTTSQAVLPLDGTPSAGTLKNYDTDRDGDPGLYMQKGDGLTETDQNKMQRWARPAGGLHLNGTPSLTLWAATKDFDTGKTGRLVAGIYDCNASHGGCSLLASKTTAFNQATHGNSFGQLTLAMSPIDVTLAANRTLVIKVGPTNSSDDDLWFAYSTTTYPANLTIN